MKSQRVWIGTSGWVYKQWAGNFYPRQWPKKNEFDYYTRHFPTVEINATFYRLPTLKMVRGWRERAPNGFVFAVKGSRFLTHMKRLKDTGRGLRRYFGRISPLAECTGPILWQLPPNFLKTEENVRRLHRFLRKLPTQYRHAVEFRHPSWMDAPTLSLLQEHRAACVWISSLQMPQDYTMTSDFVYLRFHGLKDGAYHDYTDDELAPWAKQLTRAIRSGRTAYVYFNNDLNTRAPLNAHALMRLLGPLAKPALAAAGEGATESAIRITPPEAHSAPQRAHDFQIAPSRSAPAVLPRPRRRAPAVPRRSPTGSSGETSGRRRPTTATTG